MIEDYIYARGGVWLRGSIALGVFLHRIGSIICENVATYVQYSISQFLKQC